MHIKNSDVDPVRWIRIMEGWLDPDPYGELRIRIQDI